MLGESEALEREEREGVCQAGEARRACHGEENVCKRGKCLQKSWGLEQLGESAHSHCPVWLKATEGEWWQHKVGEILKEQITEAMFSSSPPKLAPCLDHTSNSVNIYQSVLRNLELPFINSNEDYYLGNTFSLCTNKLSFWFYRWIA